MRSTSLFFTARSKTLLLRQIEMPSDPRIILDALDDDIQHIFADAQFCLDEGYELFALVRRYPYTVLDAQESKFSHDSAQALPHPFSLLGNVEDYHAVAAIPASFAARTGRHLRRLEREESSACFGDFDMFPSADFYEAHKSLLREPSRRSAGFPAHFVAALSCNLADRYEHCRRESGNRNNPGCSESSKDCILDVSLSSLLSCLNFHLPHTPPS